MSEYIAKIGFWLRAYDSFSVEAETDAEAIEKAKVKARKAIELSTQPEHVDLDERREGLVVFIDWQTAEWRWSLIEASNSKRSASDCRPRT